MANSSSDVDSRSVWDCENRHCDVLIVLCVDRATDSRPIISFTELLRRPSHWTFGICRLALILVISRRKFVEFFPSLFDFLRCSFDDSFVNKMEQASWAKDVAVLVSPISII